LDFSSEPIQIDGLGSEVAAVTMGVGHACALNNDGGVRCWGLNECGQLGNGESGGCHEGEDEALFSTVPVDVIGLESGVVAVDAGGWHTCAVIEGGGVKCWGDDYYGQIGDGWNAADDEFVHVTVPADVFELQSGITAVSAGARHTCALTGSGGIKCWGMGGYGQLGNHSTDYMEVPVDAIGFGGN
jgi:alpha-tubulin suppressor-like RCC1 family protein